jgi:CubicO group peptidase (beta-lactamase class C family)
MYPETIHLIAEKCRQGVFPGAVYRFINGEDSDTHVLGNAAIEPQTERLTTDYLFDVASLTKVVCTTTIILKLWAQKKLAIDDKLINYLPTFTDDKVTLRHLLTHTSDIQTWIPNRDQLTAEELRQAYLQVQSGQQIGRQVKYTDTGTILLGFMLEEMTGQPVTDIFQREILQPLGMTNSFFPPLPKGKKVAATQRQSDGSILKGMTHDPKARVLGKHAGNAGLFTTVDDLTKFVQMILAQGSTSSTDFLSSEIVELLYHDQTPLGTGHRSLGWDLISSPTQLFHTGYTGTFLIIDSTDKAFIFLSNRVHPQDHKESYLKHRDEIVQSYLKESVH